MEDNVVIAMRMACTDEQRHFMGIGYMMALADVEKELAKSDTEQDLG